MTESDKVYPRFYNWEYDTLHRNSKVIIYIGLIAILIMSIGLLSMSYNIQMFLFSFSLLLIIWLPLIFIMLLPKTKGRILEIKKNGLVEYNRRNEIERFHRWESLVDMIPKHFRYGDVTVLVFSDGSRVKFFEEAWILVAIGEKCKNVSLEDYYEKSTNSKRYNFIFSVIIIIVAVVLFIVERN